MKQGKLSPVSKTSNAASQYVTASDGSPESASEGSCDKIFPIWNKEMPKMACNAVARSSFLQKKKQFAFKFDLK